MPFDTKQRVDYNREKRQEKAQEKKDLQYLFDHDKEGSRHLSEVRSYGDLWEIYRGTLGDKAEAADEEDDSDKVKAKKRKKKKDVVRPFSGKFLNGKHSFPEWLALRDRARKDLFWLGQKVFKKDFTEFTHKPVCDLFVKKNFDGVYKEGYTIGDVHHALDRQERFDINGLPTKEMMLIDPRGFFKSTIDGIDCVQWLINVPDIRILILTGEYKLAVGFMREIKKYFYLAEGADPTDFQYLFPEYILYGVDGTSKEPLECPERRHNQVAASLWVNSIDANLSGWHCDIRKGDDIVTDENCNSETARENLKDKFDGTSNLLDEWGFSDYIGTRYFTDDWYAKRIDIAEEVPILYHCRACWTVKPEYQELPLRDLTKDMVILAFPEKATFASLRRKLLENERSFRNQQLNEPSDAGEDSGFKIAFDEDTLRTHLLPSLSAPREGDIYITWDWAPSSSKRSDMSVGVAARITKKEVQTETVGPDGPKITPEIIYGLTIMEIVFDRWKPSELAFQIVAFNKKWNPKQTLIEKSNGAELLQLEIQRQALKYATTLNVYWKPISLQPDAKRNRIKGLETLLSQDRLHFVGGPWIDETFYQLIRYTGERKNKGRKDDIPDAISFQTFFLPSTEKNEDLKKLQEAQKTIQDLRLNYDRIFGGTPSYTEPEIIDVPTPSVDPRSKFGIPGLRY